MKRSPRIGSGGGGATQRDRVHLRLLVTGRATFVGPGQYRACGRVICDQHVQVASSQRSQDRLPFGFPSWELFEEQAQVYRDAVLPPDVELRLAAEAGISMGWHKWVGSKGRVLGIDRYGASAPASQVFANLGLTANHAVAIANEMLHG